MRDLVTLLGLVIFVEGLPYLLSPRLAKEMMRFVLRMPDSQLRLLGAIFMAAGLVFIYIGRRVMG